jgi:hypothetical protein
MDHRCRKTPKVAKQQWLKNVFKNGDDIACSQTQTMFAVQQFQTSVPF